MPEPVVGVSPLAPESLRPRCDPGCLPFETTAELTDEAPFVGQDRAVEALRFAAAVRHDGYNVYVLGPEGVGRRSLVQRLLERVAAGRAAPADWCYLHCFERPHEPRALPLPAGLGARLRADMDRFVEELAPTLSAAFEGEAYLTRRKALEDAFEARHREAIDAVRGRAVERGLVLLVTPQGMALVPGRDGEPLSPEENEALPPEAKVRIEQAMHDVREVVTATLRQVPLWAREHRDRVRLLDRETAAGAVEHLVDELRERWGLHPEVLAWLAGVRDDVLENRDRLRGEREGGPPVPMAVGEPLATDWTRRYRVNVLVDNDGVHCPRVVVEDNPTFANLVGRVDFHAAFGALVTDFTLIRPGALHRANGGFLVVEARKLLTQPMAWEGLKRTLRAREIRIESLAQALSLTSAATLEPQPIPLDLKVVIVGDRDLYYLLAAHDPEFTTLFKVPADLEETVDRSDANVHALAAQVASLARSDALLPLDRAAVAAVLERASRLADDAEKLSTHVLHLVDLLREADHAARTAGRATVGAADVRAALAAERTRHGRLRDHVLEAQTRELVRVETDGERVGQVNGLSVALLGRASFGRASRITAQVRLGGKGVVDIEREVQLGGPIHSKGVLILTGFLGGRYGRLHPLAFTASLGFEQSYGGVDGDSASLAETLALLSAIGGVPLRQSVAVTGSMDQFGRVQAVGGVNEKIEGFFALCDARGLTGRQGVIVPAANRQHLVLDEAVVEAARAGRFHVWAVSTVDEALEIMTGRAAGAPGAEGVYPPDTVNRRVQDELVALSRRARAAAREGREDRNGRDGPEG